MANSILIGFRLGTAYSMSVDRGFSLATTFADFSIARAVQVVWLPFLFIPLSAVQFVGVPADRNNEASAIVNLMRNLGGSVGVAVATTALAWRGQFHHARLADHVTAFDGFGPGIARQAIAREVATQASILSYLDVFTILGVAAFCVAPLAVLLPTMPKGTQLGH